MGESEAPRSSERTESENTSPGQGEHTYAQGLEQEIGGTKPTEKGTESPEIRAQEEGSSGQADELGSTSEVDHERMKAQGTKLKTKNAIEIMKVVGDCSEVRQFDDLRCRLKSAKHVAPADKNRYQHIFYKLQLMGWYSVTGHRSSSKLPL